MTISDAAASASFLVCQGDQRQVGVVAQPPGDGAVAQTSAVHHGGVPGGVDAAGVPGQEALSGSVQRPAAQSHLAAVGVTAEHQIPSGLAEIGQVVRLVSQHDSRLPFHRQRL